MLTSATKVLGDLGFSDGAERDCTRISRKMFGKMTLGMGRLINLIATG